MDQPHVADPHPGGGVEVHPPREELLYLGVVVAPDNVDDVEPLGELLEEVRYLGVLLLGRTGDGVLHVADHHQTVGLVASRLQDAVDHVPGAGDQVEALLAQVGLEADVQVPDDQRVVDHQGRDAVDGLDLRHRRPSLRTSGMRSATSVAMSP